MNATPTTTQNDLTMSFEKQKTYAHTHSNPLVVYRRSQLKKLKNLIHNHREEILQAISDDYGYRPRSVSQFGEVIPSLMHISYCIKNVARWAKPEKRKTGLLMSPGRSYIHYQPLGVVGIVVPWNYPLFLTIGPLADAIAAGNSVMIKLSEYTPAFSTLFSKLISNAFPAEEITVITGGADIAAAFTSLPFNHLLFTGSTAIGKKVLEATAKNLTPVTLELGGKSPVIVTPDFPLQKTTDRICWGKLFNAGQTCVAPDYVFVPKHMIESFIAAFKKSYNTMYSKHSDHSLTHIINESQHKRLIAWLDEAKDKGARLIELHTSTHTQGEYLLNPVIITDGTDDMNIHKYEIFGPILPIIPYESIDETIEYINKRPRPLALYIFSKNRQTLDTVIDRTHSGSVCVNDTMVQCSISDLPFGGIGDSGMGSYHGHEGFKTFSHARSIHKKGRITSTRLAYPQFKHSGIIDSILQWILK